MNDTCQSLKRILEPLAVLVMGVQGLLEVLGGAEPQVVLVGLQHPLQGTDLTAPETAQDTGLQAAGPHGHTIYNRGFAHVTQETRALLRGCPV